MVELCATISGSLCGLKKNILKTPIFSRYKSKSIFDQNMKSLKCLHVRYCKSTASACNVFCNLGLQVPAEDRERSSKGHQSLCPVSVSELLQDQDSKHRPYSHYKNVRNCCHQENNNTLKAEPPVCQKTFCHKLVKCRSAFSIMDVILLHLFDVLSIL
ncbi:hypothetical protein GOODEAATRI_002596 [Goodea atripinnis]|uniref:Uncharacterized protein n=1 Tax=Goodea atripinnis TaxID=208336 RepID=A0ABV0MEG7_9TELE